MLRSLLPDWPGPVGSWRQHPAGASLAPGSHAGSSEAGLASEPAGDDGAAAGEGQSQQLAQVARAHKLLHDSFVSMATHSLQASSAPHCP